MDSDKNVTSDKNESPVVARWASAPVDKVCREAVTNPLGPLPASLGKDTDRLIYVEEMAPRVH